MRCWCRSGCARASADPMRCALRPTSTTPRPRGRSSRRCKRCGNPVRRSVDRAARMRPASPIYHGTMLQMAVRDRGRPAAVVNSGKFLAVSSGLSRDTKPEAPVPRGRKATRRCSLRPTGQNRESRDPLTRWRVVRARSVRGPACGGPRGPRGVPRVRRRHGVASEPSGPRNRGP